MKGSIVALGVILMVLGGILVISTSSEPIEFLGVKVGEQQVTPTIEFGSLEVPLSTLGLILGFVGFMTFIAGIAAAGEPPRQT